MVELFRNPTKNKDGLVDSEVFAFYTDTIITTDDPNTINQVRELQNATADLDSDNSGSFNVYANKYKHVIS